MQIYLRAVLLFTCLIFSGCSFIKPDIQEISHTTIGRDSHGDGRFYQISFKKDGAAEVKSRKFVHDVTITEQSHSRGKISLEQFEKLADVINQSGFFSKESSRPSLDSSSSIKVTTATGEKEFYIKDWNNPDTKAIIAAIEQINKQIEWVNVD